MEIHRNDWVKLIDEEFCIDGYAEIYRREEREFLKKTLETLTDRERVVIIERYGLEGKEKTLTEIGERFGVGRERVRQIEAKAMKKLRHPARQKKLEWFLKDVM